jgi:recombination protein RecA
MGILGKPTTLKASALVHRKTKRKSDFSYTNFIGRITELSASRNAPVLSFLSLLIKEVQEKGEAAVWVETTDSIFFPPDFAANGIDLAAIPVVWAPQVTDGVRAIEHLLRSNSFGLLILDLPPHTIVDQGRLGKLARMADLNQTAVVFVTGQEEGTSFTLGSIISLRLVGARTHTENQRYSCMMSAIKDKCAVPGWIHAEVFYAPDGMY